MCRARVKEEIIALRDFPATKLSLGRLLCCKELMITKVHFEAEKSFVMNLVFQTILLSSFQILAPHKQRIVRSPFVSMLSALFLYFIHCIFFILKQTSSESSTKASCIVMHISDIISWFNGRCDVKCYP